MAQAQEGSCLSLGGYLVCVYVCVLHDIIVSVLSVPKKDRKTSSTDFNAICIKLLPYTQWSSTDI